MSSEAVIRRAQTNYKTRNKEKLLEKAKLWHRKAREDPEYRKKELARRRERYTPKSILIEKTEEEIIILEKLWDSGFCVCNCRFQGGREI